MAFMVNGRRSRLLARLILLIYSPKFFSSQLPNAASITCLAMSSASSMVWASL